MEGFDVTKAAIKKLNWQVSLSVAVNVGGRAAVGLQPDTWVLILDFFGLLQPPPDASSPLPQPSTQPATAVQLSLGSAVVALRRPKPAPTLATATLASVLADVSVGPDGFRLSGTGHSFALQDETPQYSCLYPIRLSQPPKTPLKLVIHKPSGPDPQLCRDYDLRVEVESEGRATMIHTQRFLADLLTYSQAFLANMDYLIDVHTLNASGPPPPPSHPSQCAPIGRGSRISLRIALGSSDGMHLLVPVNSLCPDLLLAKIDAGVTIENDFLFHSQKTEREAVNRVSESAGHDALLDVLAVHCRRLSLHPARRVSLPSPFATKQGLEETQQPGGWLLSSEIANLLAAPTQLSVLVQRNLDAAFCKAVPDLLISCKLSRERVRVSLDTYRLVRGILDHNLGEPLPPPPPLPLRLQSHPASQLTALDTFVGFCFIMEMDRIQLDCLVREEQTEETEWKPLGEVDFSAASLSFESLSDQSREIDLIITNGALQDSRFETLPQNARPNVFPHILQRRDLTPKTANETANGPPKPAAKPSLMAEVHFVSGLGTEPRLTVLLADIRLMAILDWLDAAKDFIGSASLFQPPPPQLSTTSKRRPSAKSPSRPMSNVNDYGSCLGVEMVIEGSSVVDGLPPNFTPGVFEKATIQDQVGVGELWVRLLFRATSFTVQCG